MTSLDSAPIDQDDMPSGLGPQLREARKKRQLTLREVADRVGCSESHLSKIENGRIMPSLMTLHRITMVVGTTISTLLSHPRNEESVVTRRGTRPVVRMGESGSGIGCALEELMPDTEPHLLEASIHVLKPGANSGGAIYHDGEELGYVLEGELELTVDGETFLLGEGDFFVFRSERPHSHRNPGRNLARVLWVNTPPTF